ncbi:hypothetical protein POM88_012531 [Heracleum sosnowskyi]|uniref:Uncharacterized protein n=1 Tax=Heracleum sosnowskyi TaxID=360622 RepID=A0AAD8J0I5_9APIA|nr:hypothetical protein POM88_012531 [Heracleum sosnowskyi]
MEGKKTYKAHVMVLAYHGQGHINPMVQFSKRLASKGMKVTVSAMLSTTKAMKSASSSVIFESIYDDVTEGGVGAQGGFKAFLDRFEASGSQNLTELIKKQEISEYPVKCLVYDANLPWALAIAKNFAIPGLPPPKLPNVMSLGAVTGKHSPIIKQICKQFDNIENAEWVLFNSFDKLEEEVVKWMSNLWTVMNIGPTVPSVYLDNRVENDNDYGFNMYKPSTEACMQWLNTKETGSFLDQMTNAYLVERVWGVGVQPKEVEQNRTTAKEIGRCINEVMNGEEIRNKALEWKSLAKEAIDENGSSDTHIDEIISRIVAL